jgi:hypothetical protein
MTAIASSSETIAAGASGSWFQPAGATWVADIDTPGARVLLQTRRGAGDGAPKLVRISPASNDGALFGAQSVVVTTGVVGRQFRFVNIGDVAAVVVGDQT